MTLLTFQILAVVTIFLISFFSGWLPIHARKKYVTPVDFRLGEALASGVFLGAALFHMLPDAEHTFRQLYGNINYPISHILCALGFITLLFIEKVFFQLLSNYKVNQPNIIPYILTAVLAVHAFIAGAAVGINTSLSAAIIIFVAILAHKGFESFSLAVTLNRSQITTNRIIALFLFFCLVTPIGIMLGSLVADLLQTQQALLAEAVFNALAAGSFLYIATFHNMRPTTAANINYLYEFLSMLLGVIVMAAVAIWA